MKGSVPSWLRCHARCTFFFVLQLPFRNRCQYSHPSTVGQIAGLSTLQRRPQTRHGRGSKPPASHSALEEPVIGCGCEISARSWPCNTLQRAWRRSGCPKTVSVASALKHGLGCRRTECPIDRGVVPSSLSLWPSASCATRPLGSRRRHSIHQMQNPSPECACRALTSYLFIVQQLSNHSQPAPRASVWNMTPLAATVSAATAVPRLKGRHQTRARWSENRIHCTSTWRSAPLGRMYDGGAPGQASERLSRAGTE